jgi:hypothetical protein
MCSPKKIRKSRRSREFANSKKNKKRGKGRKGANIFWSAQIHTNHPINRDKNKSAEREAKKKEHQRLFKKNGTLKSVLVLAPLPPHNQHKSAHCKTPPYGKWE